MPGLTIASGRTLRGELQSRTAESPDRIWLIYEAIDGSVSVLTCARFLDRVYRAAHVLETLGVQPGERILLHLGNCPEFMYLWFGAACLGAVIVPTNVLSSAAGLGRSAGGREVRPATVRAAC